MPIFLTFTAFILACAIALALNEHAALTGLY